MLCGFNESFFKGELKINIGFGANRINKWFRYDLDAIPADILGLLKGVVICPRIRCDSLSGRNIEIILKGRKKYNALQLGIKYQVWDSFIFSLAYIRGDNWHLPFRLFIILVQQRGYFQNSWRMPYKSPVNFQPIESLCPTDVIDTRISLCFPVSRI